MSFTMGLDQYLFGRVSRYCKKEAEEKQDGFPVRTKELEIGYWRKHYALNDYIDSEFGCDADGSVYLNAVEIRQILDAVMGDIPHSPLYTSVSEEGEPDTEEEAAARKRHDIEVFTKALEWLEKDDTTEEAWIVKRIRYERC
jgi:hypothetical protein